jgi:6-phosphogluconolactonase
MIAIYPTAADVADAVAATIGEEIASRNSLTLGLAGGSTPAAAYQRLASEDHDWDKVTLWLSDERWVPGDHPDANARMVRRTLGDAARKLIAPRYGLGDPDRAAIAYATELEKAFAGNGGDPEIVLLGMGDDGHTASLFPGTDALDAVGRDYVANWVAAKNVWRLTATMPLLWSAERIMFIVTGEAKAGMLSRILDDQEPFPAGRVAGGADDVRWILDEAAASRLRPTPR